jgi:acyl dehydratase
MTAETDGQNAQPTHLFAQFTKRDAILYALGIGCCSDAEELSTSINNNRAKNDTSKHRELRYVYENHPEFEPFPTFLLALIFQSQLMKSHDTTSGEDDATINRLGFGIRPFPPESLGDGSGSGVIPKAFFRDPTCIENVRDLPVLHTSQKFTLHKPFGHQLSVHGQDRPINVWLVTRIVSIEPKSIGTFVTTETKFYQMEKQSKVCVATSQMTALVFGLDPDLVRRYRATIKSAEKQSIVTTSKVYKSYTYQIPPNAALIYRLSGDYNPIHVENDAVLLNKEQGQSSKKGAVLHGSCTLGYAVRAVLRHANARSLQKSKLFSVECNFVKPVFVGDTLVVTVSDEPDHDVLQSCGLLWVCFKVYRSADFADNADAKNEIVVDNGVALLSCYDHTGTELSEVSRL